MKLRELRAILQSVVLAGLPVVAGCTDEDADSDFTFPTLQTDNCTAVTPKIWRFSPPFDAELELRIESCRVDADACNALCQMAMERADIFQSPDTCMVKFLGDDVKVGIQYTTFLSGNGCASEGRRPAGLVTPSDRGVPGSARAAAAAYLAEAAWLEGASIYAFVHLARELTHFGAPDQLVRAALVAANDEVRHTTLMTRLAQRYGGQPPQVQCVPLAVRDLETIAIENAAEGCVRETWGAVVALHQAQVARDHYARKVFAAIAADELRHAALAWQIEQWLLPQLSIEARARVVAAREAAARELMDAPFPDSILELGTPHGIHARALVARTYDSLWNQGGLS